VVGSRGHELATAVWHVFVIFVLAELGATCRFLLVAPATTDVKPHKSTNWSLQLPPKVNIGIS
jgi:hypothetical protein